MAKKFTWGEALDLTLKTKWATKAALKTNKINTGHFTAFAGRSFPVERINQVQMDLFRAYLKEERDLSDRNLQPMRYSCCNSSSTTVQCVSCAKQSPVDYKVDVSSSSPSSAYKGPGR